MASMRGQLQKLWGKFTKIGENHISTGWFNGLNGFQRVEILKFTKNIIYFGLYAGFWQRNDASGHVYIKNDFLVSSVAVLHVF